MWKFTWVLFIGVDIIVGSGNKPWIILNVFAETSDGHYNNPLQIFVGFRWNDGKVNERIFHMILHQAVSESFYSNLVYSFLFNVKYLSYSFQIAATLLNWNNFTLM